MKKKLALTLKVKDAHIPVIRQGHLLQDAHVSVIEVARPFASAPQQTRPVSACGRLGRGWRRGQWGQSDGSEKNDCLRTERNQERHNASGVLPCT